MPLITGNQLRAARALVNVDQQYVADQADVNVNTIRNMEGRGFQPITSSAATVRRVEECLENLGIDFLDGKDPGVVLRPLSATGLVQADEACVNVRIPDFRFNLFTTSADDAKLLAQHAQSRGDIRLAAELQSAAEQAEKRLAERRAEPAISAEDGMPPRRPPRPPVPPVPSRRSNKQSD